MLIAHMDTIYEKGILQFQPYKSEGHRLYVRSAAPTAVL